MILHLFVADIQLNTSKSISKQCTGLKLLIVHEDDFREYGIVTHEESGHLLFKFHQTVHIPMKNTHQDHDYIHKLHFTVFALFNQNNLLEEAVRIGSGVIHTSLQDTTVTKTVILQVDPTKDKNGRLIKTTAASRNRMMKEVESGILGKLTVTFFYNDTAINIGDAVPFPTTGKSNHGAVQEYSFLLSRKLRSKDPESTVTFDPTVEGRVAKDAEWYVTEQVIAGTNKPSSADKKKSPNTTRTTSSSIIPTTNKSPSTHKSQAHNFSKENLTYSPKKKSPPAKAKVVPVEPPKLRKTHMGVGYVKNAWPEPSAAATALEKRIYQLQLASEKKLKLLKDIETQLEQNRKAQAQKNADKKVYHTELASGRAKMERHMNEEYDRQKQEKVLKTALKNREAEVKSLELQLARLRLENALAHSQTAKSSHQNNHSYSSKKSPFTTYPVNQDNSALLLTRLIQNTDKKSPAAKSNTATATANRRKSTTTSPLRSTSVDFTTTRIADRRSSLPGNTVSASMPKFVRSSSLLAGTVASEQRKTSKVVIPANHLHPKKKAATTTTSANRKSDVHGKRVHNEVIRGSVQKQKKVVGSHPDNSDHKPVISPYLERSPGAVDDDEDRYFDNVEDGAEGFDIDYDYYYDGNNHSRHSQEDRRDSNGSTFYNYDEVFPDQSEFAYSNSQFRKQRHHNAPITSSYHPHEGGSHSSPSHLADKYFQASDHVSHDDALKLLSAADEAPQKPISYGYQASSRDADDDVDVGNDSDSSISMMDDELEHLAISGDDDRVNQNSPPVRAPSPNSPKLLPKQDFQYSEQDGEAVVVEESTALNRNTKFNARPFSTEDKVVVENTKKIQGLLGVASQSSSTFEDMVSPLSMNSFDRCEYTLTTDDHEEASEHLPVKTNRIVEQFEKNKLFSPPTHSIPTATSETKSTPNKEHLDLRQRSSSFDSEKERYNELIANLSDDDTVDNHVSNKPSPQHYYNFDAENNNKTFKKDPVSNNSTLSNSKVLRWREDAELVDARIIPNNQEEQQVDTSAEMIPTKNDTMNNRNGATMVSGRQSPPSTSIDRVRNQLEKNRMYNQAQAASTTAAATAHTTVDPAHQKIISQFEKNKRYQAQQAQQAQQAPQNVATPNVAESAAPTATFVNSSAVQEDIRSKYSEIEHALGNIEERLKMSPSTVSAVPAKAAEEGEDRQLTTKLSYKDLVDEVLSKSMTEALHKSPERNVSFDNEREAFRKFLEEAGSDDEEGPHSRSTSAIQDEGEEDVEDDDQSSEASVGMEGDSSSLESDASDSFGGHADFNSLSD